MDGSAAGMTHEVRAPQSDRRPRSHRRPPAVSRPVRAGLAVAALALLGGTAVTVVSSHDDAAAAGRSWTEDFSGGALDRASWGTCYHFRAADCTNEYNHERQVYRPGNVTVSGGAAHLTASRRSATGYHQDGSAHPFAYTSGMISSADRVSFRFGYAEFRARVPKGQGIWPALWLLPQSKTWPPEIDIMEYIGSQPDRVYMTNHPGAPATPDGARAASAPDATSFAYVGPDFSQDWHTYAVDWRPESITWFVDGVERGKVTAGVPQEPMYLVANLAVGGDWPKDPDASTPFPATMDVDRVTIRDAGSLSVASRG